MFNIKSPMALLVFIVTITVCGCGTMQAYEGPKRPQNEIAVIKSNHLQSFIETAYVGELDGKDLSSIEDNVEVLPGEYTIKIYVTRGLGAQPLISSKTLILKTQPGHTYRVNGAIRNDVTYAWIIDENDGRIVSGKMP